MSVKSPSHSLTSIWVKRHLMRINANTEITWATDRSLPHCRPSGRSPSIASEIHSDHDPSTHSPAPYSMLVCNMVKVHSHAPSSKKDYRRSSRRPPKQGAKGKRRRNHANHSHRAGAGCRRQSLRTTAAASGQSSFLANAGRAEGRSMIAPDTSTWISFFEGVQGAHVAALARALQARQVVMPPPVLTELVSDPELPHPSRKRSWRFLSSH